MQRIGQRQSDSGENHPPPWQVVAVEDPNHAGQSHGRCTEREDVVHGSRRPEHGVAGERGVEPQQERDDHEAHRVQPCAIATRTGGSQPGAHRQAGGGQHQRREQWIEPRTGTQHSTQQAVGGAPVDLTPLVGQEPQPVAERKPPGNVPCLRDQEVVVAGHEPPAVQQPPGQHADPGSSCYEPPGPETWRIGFSGRQRTGSWRPIRSSPRRPAPPGRPAPA